MKQTGKRILSLLLVLAILISIVPNAFASDQDYDDGGDYYTEVENTEPTEAPEPSEEPPAETEPEETEVTGPTTPAPVETEPDPAEEGTEPSEVTEPTEEPEPTDEAPVVTEPETTEPAEEGPEETEPETTEPADETTEETEPEPTEAPKPTETQPMDEPIAPGKNEEEPPTEESIEEPTEPEEDEIRDFAHGWLDIPSNGDSAQGISGTQAAGYLQYNGYIYFANSEKGVDWIKSYTLTNDYGQSISLTADIHAWEIKRLNGKVTYCIEPSNGSSDSLYYGSGSSFGLDDNWGNYFNYQLRYAIGLLMLYSQTHHPASLTSQDSIEWEVATQIILWEFVTGCRDTTHPYTRTDNSLAAMYFNGGVPEWEYATNQYAKLYNVSTYYSIIANELALHRVIPSFTKRYVSQALTYELPRQADGSFKLTLTDTNNVLSKYSFASASPITVSQSGNKLTLTAPKGSVVPSELTFRSSRDMPNENDPNYVLTVFVNHTNGMQDVIQPMTGSIPSDPVPAYFKAALQKSGTMTIKKTAANGDVASYKFRFYNAATSSLYYGVSDTDGRIYATDSSYKAGSKVYTYEDMKDGSYTFTEALSLTPDKRCWPDYVRVTVSDASGKVVQDTKLTGSQLTNVNGDCRTAYVDVVGLTDGGVLTVEFHNQPLPGTATLKKTTDYGPVDGYKFRLYNAADKSLVCGISDADGRIYQVGSDWQLTGAKNYIFDGLVDGTYDLREVITQSAHKDAFPDYVIVTVKDHDGKTVNSHRYEADSIINDKGDALIKGMVITGLSGEGTMELTIHNAAKPGTMTIKKTASNGDVEGYPFSVYNSSALSGKTRFGKSDANGDVYRTDASYQAEDRDYEFRGMQDGTYSFREAITKAEHQNVFPDYWEITVWDKDGVISYSHKFTGEEIANENGDAVLRNVAITGLTGGGRMEMEIHNVPQTAPVTIKKVADDGNVAGITFECEKLVSGSWKKFAQKTTDQDGIIDLGEMPIGIKLRISEIVPYGYKAEVERQEITVVEGENIVTFVNHPLYGGLELRKIDPDEPEAILTGAAFTAFKKGSTEGVPLVEVEPGLYRLTGLLFGEYTVQETAAPEGYALDETVYTVEINDEKIFEIAAEGLNGVPNHQIPGSIKARKVDEKDNPLKGVGFLLEYSLDEGTTWKPVFLTEDNVAPGGCSSEGLTNGMLYTDEDGIVEFTGLRRTYGGKDILYRLTEKSSLPGYEPLLDASYTGPLPADAESGYAVDITVVNSRTLDMPSSGGYGMVFVSIGICGMLLVAAYLFVLARKKYHN